MLTKYIIHFFKPILFIMLLVIERKKKNLRVLDISEKFSSFTLFF